MWNPLVFPIFFLVHFAICLNCFVCNSSVDPGCLDGEFQAHILNLDVRPSPCSVRDAKFCIKTTTIYGGKRLNQFYVSAIMGTTRFCSSKHLGDQCQYVDFPDHDRIYQACVFTCENDACNAARSRLRDLCVCFVFLIITIPAMDTRLLF
ncbi:unnamed protein product [Taenia asiatica]|uniref:Protein sleepless n=1 Tax=Taenia asiatica TaxID=60517 RepID=A0A0R3VVN1_TAEAS|nr:unnamed protein product [Taenia asiatica]